MQVKFYAGLRRIVGGKVVEVTLQPEDTLRSVLNRLVEQHPDLRREIWGAEGQLSDYIHVFLNGREARYLPATLDTPLQANDVIDVFPPVAGGKV